MRLIAALLLVPAASCSPFWPYGMSVSKPSDTPFGTEPAPTQQCTTLGKTARDNMALDASARCLSPCFVVIKPAADSLDLCHGWSVGAYWFEGACTMRCDEVDGFGEILRNGTCTVHGQPLPLYFPNAPATTTYALPMRCTDTRCAFALTLFVVESDFACSYAIGRDIVTCIIMFVTGVMVFLKAANAWTVDNNIPLAAWIIILDGALALAASMLWDFILILGVPGYAVYYGTKRCRRKKPPPRTSPDPAEIPLTLPTR